MNELENIKKEIMDYFSLRSTLLENAPYFEPILANEKEEKEDVLQAIYDNSIDTIPAEFITPVSVLLNNAKLLLTSLVGGYLNKKRQEFLISFLYKGFDCEDEELINQYVLPLKYEELYNALGLLDDLAIRKVLSSDGVSKFNQLSDAYQKGREVFVKKCNELQISKSCLTIYFELYRLPESSEKFSLTLFDELVNNESNNDVILNNILEYGIENDKNWAQLVLENQEECSLEKYAEMMAELCADNMSIIKGVCLRILSDKSLPTIVQYRLRLEWEKFSSFFEDYEPVFMQSNVDENVVAGISGETLFHTMQNLIDSELPKSREEKKISAKALIDADNLETNFVKLEKSRILIDGNRTDHKEKIYREALEILYDFLTENKRGVIDLKRDGQSVNIGPSLECTLEEFLFLFNYRGEKLNINSQPILNWINTTAKAPKQEFIALLYALYWDENGKSEDQKKQYAPSTGEQKNLCRVNSKSINKLSENPSKVNARIDAWIVLLKDCLKKATGRYTRGEI